MLSPKKFLAISVATVTDSMQVIKLFSHQTDKHGDMSTFTITTAVSIDSKIFFR